MQRDRHRVPLGGRVVLGPPVGAEERVEVVLGAGLGGPVSRVSQREVEEDQAAALLVQLADGEIVRLDVAVPDALALQVPDRLEQMVAEGLQIADGEPAFAAQVLPKGLLAGLLEDQDGAVTDVLRAVDESHDVRVAEVLELGGLVRQPGPPGVAERDLVDAAGIVPGHQQRSRCGALAEDLADLPAIGHHGALGGREQVGDLVLIGAGEFLLDQIEVGQEVPHRLETVDRLRARRVADQIVHRGTDLVAHRGRDQRMFGGQPDVEFLARARRRDAGQDQVRQRAETEDVELGGVGLRIAEFRRKVRAGGRIDVRAQGRRRPGRQHGVRA